MTLYKNENASAQIKKNMTHSNKKSKQNGLNRCWLNKNFQIRHFPETTYKIKRHEIYDRDFQV